MPEKLLEDGPRTWIPATHMEDQGRELAPGLTQATLAIWDMNQKMEENTSICHLISNN